jgi:hypothetical protein
MKNETFNQNITHAIRDLREQESILKDFLDELLQEGKSVTTFEVEQAINELTTAIQSLEDTLK